MTKLVDTDDECWNTVSESELEVQCLHKITSLIVTKYTKGVLYEEILELQCNVSFSEMASMLSKYVKNHWLIFDEAAEKYCLGPKSQFRWINDFIKI